jgi:tellurite resistance protein TehA-like permease
MLADILFFMALLIFCIIAANIRLLRRSRFNVSFWACTFPLVAVTQAAALYTESVGGAQTNKRSRVFFSLFSWGENTIVPS